MATRIVRTTFALPLDLIEAADRLVRRGGARSRTELVTAALQRELEARERASINASLADMSRDEAYLHELGQIMEEFAAADSEGAAEAAAPPIRGARRPRS